MLDAFRNVTDGACCGSSGSSTAMFSSGWVGSLSFVAVTSSGDACDEACCSLTSLVVFASDPQAHSSANIMVTDMAWMTRLIRDSVRVLPCRIDPRSTTTLRTVAGCKWDLERRGVSESSRGSLSSKNR